jgi:uncharacterized UBP type Zn finger protein
MSGLYNLGGTCYLNATVSALASCPAFVHSLVRWSQGTHGTHGIRGSPGTRGIRGTSGGSRGTSGGPSGSPSGDQESVVEELAELVARMWADGRAARLSPHGLVDSLEPLMMSHGLGRARRQNDSHEIYTLIADAVTDVGVGGPVNPIGGHTQQTVRCENCGKETVGRPEPFTSLAMSLDAHRAARGQEEEMQRTDRMLETLMAPERVKGYACDSCGSKNATAAIITRLWDLPPVLVLSIKRRLRVGGDEIAKDEVDTVEVIPASLVRRLSARGSPASRSPPGEEYRLSALVVHSGSADSGHYVTYARHPGDNVWHLHDDETVVSMASLARDEASRKVLCSSLRRGVCLAVFSLRRKP